MSVKTEIMKFESLITLRNEVSTLRTRLQQVESERDEAKVARDFAELACQRKEADAAVMREVLEKSMSVHRDRLASVFDHKDVSEVCLKALSTSADKSLLERLKEAEWLICNSGEPSWRLGYTEANDWLKRRDTFLNPKPQDVK